jgi:hypothetical protein
MILRLQAPTTIRRCGEFEREHVSQLQKELPTGRLADKARPSFRLVVVKKMKVLGLAQNWEGSRAKHVVKELSKTWEGTPTGDRTVLKVEI